MGRQKSLEKKTKLHYDIPISVKNKLVEIAEIKGMTATETVMWLIERYYNKLDLPPIKKN